METIKYWNKELRSWIVYEIDKHGNQIGYARYYANKTSMNFGESCE